MEAFDTAMLLGAQLGATSIVAHSSLAAPVKAWLPPRVASFLDCGQCTGFWVGFLSSAVLHGWEEGLSHGFVVSLLGRLLSSVLYRLETDDHV